MHVGAFTLEAPLAEGGMGAVWSARHTRSGHPVAVKVLRPELATAPEALLAFEREARTAASLDHPAILRVLDHGVVAADTGPLAKGAPYLVMERAFGTLADAAPYATWDAIRASMLSVLDALATLHARDLCHRDIKPENVLLVGEDWKLADFGIAHALRDAQDAVRIGTPLYMAPEQIRGGAHELSGATDLYALGASLWHVCSGTPPFAGGTRRELLDAHLLRDPGDFRPRTSVPVAVEGWLRACLEKDPSARFSCAAEAADHLPKDGPWLEPVVVDVSPGSATFSMTALPEPLPAAAHVDRAQPRKPMLHRPDWRRPIRPRPAPTLADAGLNLLGLREPDTTGRTTERDALWEALTRAGTEPIRVALTGPRGIGKTALARWFCRRVREFGPSPLFHAIAGQTDQSADLLQALTESLLRSHGTNRQQLVEQLRRRFPRLSFEDQARIVGALRPDRARLDGWAALDVLLGQLPAPALIWIDGDLAPDLTEDLFARWLALGQPGVLLLSGGAPPTRADLHLALGPMPDAEIHALCEALLPLEPTTAQRVVALADGNPGRALSRLTAWSQSSEGLHVGPDGFEVDPALWTPELELDAALDSLAGPSRRVLQIAALMGPDVPDSALRSACERAGLPDPVRALRDLARAGYLTQDATLTWSAPSAAVQLAALSQVGANTLKGPAARALLDLADALRADGNPYGALRVLERARSLSRECGGRLEASVALGLGRHRSTLGRLDQARVALHDALALARACGDVDIQGRVLCQFSTVESHLGQLEASLAHNREALALEGQSVEVQAMAHGNIGSQLRRLGQPDLARVHLDQALDLARRAGMRSLEAMTISNLAMLAEDAGQDELAMQLCVEAHALDAGTPSQRAVLRLRLANRYRMIGDYDEATSQLRDILDYCRDCGLMVQAATVLTGLGNVHSERGDRVRALEAYQQAAATARSTSTRAEQAIAQINAAMMARELGQIRLAVALLSEAVPLAEAVGHSLAISAGHTEWAHALLLDGRPAQASVHADTAIDRLKRHQDPDYLRTALWVRATSALDRREPDVARAALAEAEAVAQTQGVALGARWTNIYTEFAKE